MRRTNTAPAATKPAVCRRLNQITVRGADYGREIGAGERVDLLETDAAGVTLEELLGHHVAAFDVVDGSAETFTPAASAAAADQESES